MKVPRIHEGKFVKHPGSTMISLLLAVSSATAVAQDLVPKAPGLEEVVVTARKRAESLQDTPIAVTTFTGEDLEERGYANISGIAEATPNMTFSTTASNSGSNNAAVVFLRGVGQSDFYPHIDPGVGIYLDGVYISRTTGAVLDSVDIEQIEVLRGPQGTLFGKNTIGGAISITTIKPLDYFAAEAKVTLGDYSRTDGRLMVNAPITDTLLSRFSVSSLQRDGYIESNYDGSEYGDIDSLSGRAAFTWHATDALSMELAGDVTRKKEASSGSTLVQVNENPLPTNGTSPWVHNNLTAPTLPGGAVGENLFNNQWITGDPYKTNADGDRSKSHLDLWGTHLIASWDIDNSVEFKSVTAYRTADSDNDRDGDASPLTLLAPATRIDQDQWSQEVQLAGLAFDQKLNWMVGAFYLKENVNFKAPVDIAFVATDNESDIENESIAVFAQATYSLTDSMDLTVGGRQTRDEKSNDTKVVTRSNPAFEAVGAGDPVPVPPGIPLLIDNAKETFKKFTPMVTLDYRWTDSLMTYLTWSEGFKSGGYSQRIAFPREESPSFDPETVASTELGAKWDGWDNRLRINAALFYAKYDDMQVVVFNQIEPLNENAGDATIQGAELELTAVPVDGLTVSLGAGYTDAEYDSIDPGTLIPPDAKLAYTPELTANLSIAYAFTLGHGQLSIRGDASYRDDTYFDALNHESLRQSEYTLYNANLTYVSDNDRWKVSVFGTNLTDKEYIVGGFADLVTSGFVDATYGRPREWGVSLTWSY